MSKNIENDATHPANMSQEDVQASLALLDEEDLGDGSGAGAGAVAAAGESVDGAASAAGAEAGAADDGGEAAGSADAGAADANANANGEGSAGAGAGGDGAAAADATAGADDDKVDRKAFNGLMAELRATREEVKALKAQQATAAELALPEARDFKAEKASLREKWDAGDIDTDEYNEQRDALTVAEARHASAVDWHARDQAKSQQLAASDWNKAITTWQSENADFLANPLRRNAVSQVLDSLEADPATAGMSNEELIQRAQEIAFDAFNWKRSTGKEAEETAPDPRGVAAARAASAASATPPFPGRGAGSALTASDVKLETLKPGEFGKLPAHVQKELLGEEA